VACRGERPIEVEKKRFREYANLIEKRGRSDLFDGGKRVNVGEDGSPKYGSLALHRLRM